MWRVKMKKLTPGKVKSESEPPKNFVTDTAPSDIAVATHTNNAYFLYVSTTDIVLSFRW